LLGAALLDRLGAQRLDALNDPRQIFAALAVARACCRKNETAQIIEQRADLIGQSLTADAAVDGRGCAIKRRGFASERGGAPLHRLYLDRCQP
jgi:DNA-directed RNA polymerase subunit N (RpoN/RPB10)